MKSNSIYSLPQGFYVPLVHQNSPLKRKRKEVGAVATRALKSPSEPPLEKKLKIEVLSFEQVMVEGLPISIQLQCETLQSSLQQRSVSLQENNLIIKIVGEILSHPNWNEYEKLTELGILHYYVASHKLVPVLVNDTLLNHRIYEIEREAWELKEKHETSFDDESKLNLPSGATAYLMRAISRMIFPPDGSFNLGGCYAVISLLKSQINLHLCDEMSSQILNITRLFINDEDFRMLFLEPFEVHPQMEELICLDLKLPLKEKMSFIYVRWCLVTALFTPVGQLDHEPNCYAVATLLNLLIDSPRNVVQLMIEALRKGSISFEQVEIPIFPLLESRRHYESDFQVQLTPDKARGLVPYLMANSALGIPTVPKVYLDKHQSLNALIEQDFNGHVKSAKEFFMSHRVSFLQQMVLAILQFAAQNNIQSKELESSKLEFCNKIIKKIKFDMNQWINISVAEQDPLWRGFFSKFESSLKDSIFCVDYTHWDFQVKDNKVVFAFHSQGFVFNGNLKDYKEFKKLRRFFHFSSLDGSFKPVDRLSAFAECCVQYLDKSRSPFDSFAVKQWCRLLRNYLQSAQFCDQLAQIVASSNKEEDASLSSEEYLKADSLFLIQDGGFFTHARSLPAIKEKFQHKMIISGLEPSAHFINLCGFIKNNHDQLGSQILAQEPHHGFNITQNLFQSYLSDPINALQTRVIFPGERLLYKQLSDKQMERTLKMALGIEESEKFVKENLSAKSMTCVDFASLAQQLLEPDVYGQFKSALNHVVLSFKLNNLLEKLPTIFKELGLTVSEQTLNEVVFEIEDKANQSFFNPSEGAALIQEALIVMVPSIFIPKFTLEEAIRKSFDFPQVIWVGNLNWVEPRAEQPDFNYLILKYDIAEKQVVYEQRCGTEDSKLSDGSRHLCEETSLYF